MLNYWTHSQHYCCTCVAARPTSAFVLATRNHTSEHHHKQNLSTTKPIATHLNTTQHPQIFPVSPYFPQILSVHAHAQTLVSNTKLAKLRSVEPFRALEPWLRVHWPFEPFFLFVFEKLLGGYLMGEASGRVGDAGCSPSPDHPRDRRLGMSVVRERSEAEGVRCRRGERSSETFSGICSNFVSNVDLVGS